MITRELGFISEEERICFLLHCLRSDSRIDTVSVELLLFPEASGQGVNVIPEHHPVQRLRLRETVPFLPYTSSSYGK